MAGLKYLPHGHRLLSGKLLADLSETATTAVVNNPPAASKLPTYIEIDYGTDNAEVVRVIGVSGNTITIERGINTGGVGIAHSQNALYKEKITSTAWNKVVDAVESGYLTEDPSYTFAQVSSSSFKITAPGVDRTGMYTPGRTVRLNGSTIVHVVSSSYSSPDTIVTVRENTVPASITSVEIAIGPKGNFYAPFDGWIAANETWTFNSWDASVYTGVITVPSNATTKYSPGMRIKITQSTGGTKYGIITAVSSTSLTVFFGTDYTLNNEAISNPYYSPYKAPLGFPLNPTKWSITSNEFEAYYNPITQNTWLYPNDRKVDIPPGVWNVSFIGVFRSADNIAKQCNTKITLSTTTNSETNINFTALQHVYGANAVFTNFHKFDVLNLNNKTTYYILVREETGGMVAAGFLKTRVIAVCAYL